ncbi:Strongly-conserved Zn-finger binding protein (TFIIIA) [Loxospora ochrophaea]|nr:Strongly-conserved Zn-finger binding protein (TFIIIA) [Loxospora ochrophaea]
MVHEGRKAFVCQETNDDGTSCNAGFDTAGKLSTHSGRVHGAKRYWCTVCPPSSSTIDASLSIPAESPSFSTYAALQSHIKTVHPPTCQDCGLQLSTARELAQHLELHHSTQTLSERQKHICPEPSCGRGFTTKGNLKVHIRTVHAGEKRFVCGTTPISELHNIGDWAGLDGCGEEFGTKGNLETHIRGVHLGVDRSLKAKRKAKKRGSGGKKRQMTAPTGGEGGERSEMIKRLTGAGYSDDPTRTIPCVLAPQCGFRFAREYDRDVHLRSKHGLTEGQARELLLLGGADPGSGVNEGYGYAAAAPVTAAAVGDGTGYVEGVFGTAPVPVSGSWGLEEAIEQTGRNGGPFWVGGVGRDWSQDEASDLGERDGEWEADEVVMGGEEVCIDPILR